MKTKVTGVILTSGLSNKLHECVQSLRWCSEILVIIDGEKPPADIPAGVKIYRRKIGGDFAAQRNFALDKAQHDWVLFLDDDEILPPQLIEEITSVTGSETGTVTYGYFIRREDYFLGKPLRFGETGAVQLLRLGNRRFGSWSGRVHEVWQISGRTGYLHQPIRHYPHEDVYGMLKKINIYTDLLAREWLEMGREVHLPEMMAYPAGKFLQNYIFRSGFRDGIPGLIMAFMMSFHSFLARVKLWNIKRRQ